MPTKPSHKLELTYYIEEKDGRYYVYYLQVAPVETLFDVARTREQAEQAIKDHEAGKHATQYRPD
jgi:hypothetical protein